MTSLTAPDEWTGRSRDPNDEQFGDVVETATLETADGYEAVLVGEPYDGGVIGRPGASEGPRALRNALSATKTCHLDDGAVRSVADLGDVRMPDGPTGAVQDHVGQVTTAVHDTDALPVFIGGDNSLTVANVTPLLDQSVGVVNFDAHLDVREVREEPTSGTPYRQLFDAGLDGYAVVGARHFETSTEYVEYVATRGGTVVGADDVGSGAENRIADAMSGVDAVYVSVDLDVLDAPAAPGVSAPTPGGLTPGELYDLLATVAGDDRLAGVEVVECAPPLDEGERTARAGARAIAHALSAHQRGEAA